MARKIGLQKDEIIPMGKLCRLDFMKIIDRLKGRPDGKYIEGKRPSLPLLSERVDDDIHGAH